MGKMITPVFALADVERGIQNIRSNVATIDPYNTPVVLYINGRHYRVTSLSLCDGRLEFDYDHANPID